MRGSAEPVCELSAVTTVPRDFVMTSLSIVRFLPNRWLTLRRAKDILELSGSEMSIFGPKAATTSTRSSLFS